MRRRLTVNDRQRSLRVATSNEFSSNNDQSLRIGGINFERCLCRATCSQVIIELKQNRRFKREHRGVSVIELLGGFGQLQRFIRGFANQQKPSEL